MSWGVPSNSVPKEKLKSEMADFLSGLNSTGRIDYETYSETFDFTMDLLDKMHKTGFKERVKNGGRLPVGRERES